MELVVLKPLTYRGKECIGIYFRDIKILNKAIRAIATARWSPENRCWYLPLTKENYLLIFSLMKQVATIDDRILRDYLINKKKNLIRPGPNKLTHVNGGFIDDIKTGLVAKSRAQRSPGIVYKTDQIDEINAHVLPAMEQRLSLKAYSRSTAKTYLNEMSRLLQALKSIPADQLSQEQLKRYLVHCYDELHLSENTLHSRINAMKFYYEQVLGREKFFWDIPRPKKKLLLPRLLNEMELASLFNALTNRKHKAMLFTAYSAGLRVSEIVNLKISDIDSGRMQILIAQSKGKKDRYVNLSPILLDILRKYITEYKPRPKTYLFESEQTFLAYPIRTVQQIFSNAKYKAGIKKDVGVHSLRHSFATHLLDKGTDIKYIKDLLGHFNIKTTERYLHVSKKKLINIISPFDDLWRSEQLDW